MYKCSFKIKAMKSKIILALTLLITLAVTSADAQSVRKGKEIQRKGYHRELRKGHMLKADRHRLVREKRHYRKDKFRVHRNDHLSYRHKKHFHQGRKKHNPRVYGYGGHGPVRYH